MANIILHECIHLGFRDFGKGTLEWTTRTLETKLKPIVQQIAQPMIDNKSQKVSAYVAHTKPGMAYRNDNEKDDYNEANAWGKSWALRTNMVSRKGRNLEKKTCTAKARIKRNGRRIKRNDQGKNQPKQSPQ